MWTALLICLAIILVASVVLWAWRGRRQALPDWLPLRWLQRLFLGVWLELRCRHCHTGELSWEEKEFLARHTVGERTWQVSTPNEREEIITSRVWESKQKFDNWKDRYDFRHVKASEQKRYYKTSNGGYRLKPRGRAFQFFVPDHSVLWTIPARHSAYKTISNRAISKLKELVPDGAHVEWCSTQDFIRAAEHVRDNNITIPSELIDDLRTAIHLRTMCTMAHGEASSSRGKKRAKQSERLGHQHFIHVLQQCLDMLLPPHIEQQKASAKA